MSIITCPKCGGLAQFDAYSGRLRCTRLNCNWSEEITPKTGGIHEVSTPLGTLVIQSATDPDHPGWDISLRPEGEEHLIPLVLTELNEGQIQTHVWGKASQEDPTHAICHDLRED